MRYLLYGCFLIFWFGTAFGQELPLLEQELTQTNPGTEHGALLCSLSVAYVGVDSARAFSYAEQALRLAQRERDTYGTGQAFLTLGGACFDYNLLSQAETHYQRAQTQFEQLLTQDSSRRNKKAWIESTLNLSATLGRQERNEASLAYAKALEPMAHQVGDYKTLAIVRSNLGVYFLNAAEYSRAYSYFQESSAFYRQINSPLQHIQDRILFAQCLYQLDSMARMAQVLAQAKQLLNDHPETQVTCLPAYHLARGNNQLYQENYAATIAHYDTAYTLVQESGMVGDLQAIFQHYTEAYAQRGQYEQAKQYILRYIEEGRQDADPEDELSAIRELANYEAQQQRYDSAYTYLLRYVAQSDSVDVATTQQAFNALEQEYQAERKERKILSLQQQNGEAALVLERNRSQLYLLLLASVILVFGLVSAYLAYRHQRRKAQRERQQRADEVSRLKHAQQAQTLSALIEGQERERRRLARDLHDGLGGRLSGISLKLSRLGQEKLNGSTQLVEHVRHDLDNSLVELRSIARNLTPETLLHYGLQAALEDYCSSLDDQDTKVILQFYGDVTEPDEAVRLTLYRIIQELINNAMKYAQATEVLVQYIQSDDSIDITVEDDGVGFRPDQMTDASHTGLVNVRHRVDYLDGTFDIQSSAQEGTTATIRIHA